MNSLSWVCITAISVIGIIALVIVFQKNNVQTVSAQPAQTGVSYVYDEQGRLKSIIPNTNIKLVPAGG